MLLSGGIDSAACLYLCRKRGYTTRALTIRFHRMARGELTAARKIAKAAEVEEHRLVSIPELRELTDIGPVTALRGLPGTYIPMKNATYYSLAAAYAEETGSSRLVGGHNRDDLELFEDTSDRFFSSLQRTLREGSSRLRRRRLVIWRPLRRLSKPRVVRLAHSLGVPLGLTWSCHAEGSSHCGKCDGCLGRVQSFEKAGLIDPLSMREIAKNV